MKSSTVSRLTTCMCRLLIAAVLPLSMVACTSSEPDGFSLPGSPIHFQTVKFEDPAQLAEANGLKFLTSRVLQASSTLKALDQERSQAKDEATLRVIEEKSYTESMKQIAREVSSALIKEDAMKSKLPLEDYIEAKIINKRGQEASLVELKARAKASGLPKSELTPEKLTQFVAEIEVEKKEHAIEDYVAKNLLTAPVKVSLKSPFHTATGEEKVANPLVGLWRRVTGLFGSGPAK